MIKIDVSPMLKTLRGLDRQGRYAMSLALTDIVNDIKDDTIGRLPHYFTIRSGWLAKGFRTNHATRDKLVAWVGQKDPFMAAQALGGTKPPEKGQMGIPQDGTVPGSIPMPRGTSGERPTYRGSNWPKQLIRAIDAFEAKRTKALGKKKGSKSQVRMLGTASRMRASENKLVFLRHASVPTLAIRIASGKGRGKYAPLWFLRTTPVKIPKRWGFFRDGEMFARAYLPPVFQYQLDKAYKDMRTS